MPITRAYGQASQLGNTPAASNPVINGAFDIWQRGTSFTPNASTYTADRWVGYRGTTGMTVSRQTTGDTTNLPNIQYCARVQRDSGNTSTGSLQFGQMFETVNSIPYAGKTVTLSFYARKGANFSAGNLDYYLITGTGTDQNYFSSYTGAAFNGAAATLTTTWARYSATFTLSSTMTEMCIVFAPTMSGTAGAADYYEVTGIQIDVGSVALPFRTYAATLAGELAACQRYYSRFGGQDKAAFSGSYYSTTSFYGILNFSTMRVAPTLSTSGSNAFEIYRNATYLASTAVSAGNATVNSISIVVTTATSTAGHGGFARFQSGAEAYLDLSAEL